VQLSFPGLRGGSANFLTTEINHMTTSSIATPATPVNTAGTPIVKTTFHGESPWAALHLVAQDAAATEAMPRTRMKPATKAKSPKKAALQQ